MKRLMKKCLSFLLVFTMICSSLVPFGNKTYAKEVEGDVITEARVTDGEGNPFKPGQKVGAYQGFKIYAKFKLPDNVVKENDTVTMTLPIGIDTAPPDHFDIKDADNNLIAKAQMYNENPAKIVLTFTKYVETHSGVKGEFYFNVSVNPDKIKETGKNKVTLEVNGKLIPAGDVDYNPPQFKNTQFNKGGWMTSDKTVGKYDIRINQDNVALVNAKFEDTLQSENVSFIQSTLKILNGKWENHGSYVILGGQKDVTQEFIAAGKVKFEGKKLTINIGDYPEANEKRGFQILYEVKLGYAPIAGEEIKNKANLTYDDKSFEKDGNYKIKDAGGTGEGYVFKLRVLKTGENNKPLAGAKFDVIRVRNNAKVGEIITGQDGSGEIGKLLRDEYRLVETEAPQGYQKLTEPITVNPADFGSDKIALKNIKNEPEAKEKVSGEKTWDDNNDQDGKRPPKITVILKKTVDGQTSEVKRQDVTPNSEGKWKYEFTNLPLYEDGKPITYSVDEVDVPGYTKETTATSATNGPDYNLKNTHKPEKRTIEGQKIWNDNNNQDGKRPTSIKVKLYKKVGNNNQKYVTEKVVTEGADKAWKWKFENLDKYENKQEIQYTVEEEAVGEGYVGIVTGSMAAGFKITNSRTPEVVNVQGTKTWNDTNNQDGKRPDKIKVILSKTVDGQTTKVTEKEVTKDNWNYEFTNLPKYEGGKEITYSIDEEAVPGYEKSIDGYNLKNSYTPEVVNVQGTKTWNDANNQDGKRPDKIKVILNKTVDGKTSKVAEKEVTKDNWNYEFNDLPKYENGKEITYSIDEEAVPGYEKEVTGYNLKNSHTPEVVNVQGTKIWVDNNDQAGKRPGSIKVILNKTVDGKTTKVAEKEVTAKDNWNYEFTNLPKYEGGKVIKYSIDEVDVPGYEKSIKGYNLENKYIPPKPKLPKTGSAPSEVGGLGVLGLLAGYVLIRRKNKAN